MTQQLRLCVSSACAAPHDVLLHLLALSKGGYFNSLGHHHLDELLVIDLPISVNVSLPDHFIDLLVSQLLTKICHHMPQLRSTDESIAIAVENFESFDQLLFCVSVLHLTGHQREELGEVNCPVSISVDFVDHVLQLCLGWVLTQRAHDCSQLLGGDSAITVLIEE